LSAALVGFAAAAVGAGAVVGLLAGLLGIGGGMILVPVLFELVGELGCDPATAMRSAIATSLACVIATGGRSALSHYRRGSLDMKLVAAWAPAMILGSLCGAEIATRIDASTLITVFAGITMLLALNMAFGRSEWGVREPSRFRILRTLCAMLVGVVASLLGIGVAGLGVPLMTFFNASVRAAVAAAALMGALAAIPATLRFIAAGWDQPQLPPWSFGYVNVLGAALILPSAMFAAPFGAGLSHKVSHAALKRVFAGFLILNAVRMLLF